MAFNPDSIEFPKELLDDICGDVNLTCRDIAISFSQWGATQAVEALRHQWPEPITDRPPTEKDGDECGFVQSLFTGTWSYEYWENVAKKQQPAWLHTPRWRPKPEPTPKERALALLRIAAGDVLVAGGFSPDGIALLRQVVESAPDTLANPMTNPATDLDLKMLPIPAGSFLMGSPEDEPGRFDDEGPQHEVTLDAFWMAQTPITQAQWRTVAAWPKVERDLDSDPSYFKGDNRPVERVSWFDAQEFCRRLSQRTGQRYGLPSEAQWEYACRAGSTTPFHFGAMLTPDRANYDGSATCAVASFPVNAWGLHDMHGNVWEWCLDEWHSNYESAPNDGSAREDCSLGESEGCCAAALGATAPGTAARPTATTTSPSLPTASSVSVSVASGVELRLLRGGSWNFSPRFCRSAYRFNYPPDNRDLNFGFRVCCLPQD